MMEARKVSRSAMGVGPCVIKPATLFVLFCRRLATPRPSALMLAGNASSHAPRLGESGSEKVPLL